MNPIRALSFNCWVGQRGRGLRDNLEQLTDVTLHPAVVSLQECRLQRTIEGYARYAADHLTRPEATLNQLLVRRGVKVLANGFLKIRGPRGDRWWTGPKHGKRHPPRVWPWVIIEWDGEIVLVLGGHRVTNTRGINVRDREVEERQVERFIRRRQLRGRLRGKRINVLALADWNGKPRRLAGRLGATTALVHIDGALAVGLDIDAQKLKQKFGADNHHPVLVTARQPIRST